MPWARQGVHGIASLAAIRCKSLFLLEDLPGALPLAGWKGLAQEGRIEAPGRRPIALRTPALESFVVRPQLADSCRRRSSIADIAVCVCFRDQATGGDRPKAEAQDCRERTHEIEEADVERPRSGAKHEAAVPRVPCSALLCGIRGCPVLACPWASLATEQLSTRVAASHSSRATAEVLNQRLQFRRLIAPARVVQIKPWKRRRERSQHALQPLGS